MNIDRKRRPASDNRPFWENEGNQNFSINRRQELLNMTWIDIHDRFSFRPGDILVQADGDEIILVIKSGLIFTGMIGLNLGTLENGDVQHEATIEAHTYDRWELWEKVRTGQMMVICPERGNYSECLR